MTPFSPSDMMLANDTFGAMCGHGALAAALGIPVVDAMKYFQCGGWVNVPRMKAAIIESGKQVTRNPFIPPCGIGVALIQFLGRWMEPKVPKTARCAHRHWIAFNDYLVWDSNTELWHSMNEWEGWVPALYSEKTTGHKIDAAYIIS